MPRQPNARTAARLERELANTRFERILSNASQISLLLLGLVAMFTALSVGQYVLAPIFIAVTLGLMCGPLADQLEGRGVPPSLSAAVVVVALLAVGALAVYLFANPLSAWLAKIPVIWERLSAELANLKGPLESIGAMEEQVRGIFGDDGALTVTVTDGGPVTNMAFLAPAILGQFVIFLGALYFFLASRHGVRLAVLSLCYTRRLRWRMAHVFSDVETRVSRYLLTITLVNIALGSLVAIAMAATGMPSPLLWGALAFVLNYIPFLGQATVLALVFLIALGTKSGLTEALIPAGLYWGLSFAESQVVTPNLLGRTMTINPFVIFLSLVFWLWVWGPVGGLVAVPSVLVLHSLITHVIPMRPTSGQPASLTSPGKRSLARKAAISPSP
ncbi:MAG TPA: AI-2E family transporter [Devosia sp.]|nr:AI-2E family transporter [Devosia sp.]